MPETRPKNDFAGRGPQPALLVAGAAGFGATLAQRPLLALSGNSSASPRTRLNVLGRMYTTSGMARRLAFLPPPAAGSLPPKCDRESSLIPGHDHLAARARPDSGSMRETIKNPARI